MTHLERQVLEFYGTLYENRNFDKYEETLKNLVSVLKITMADYELGELPRQLLTKTEIFILNNIARCKYELGEKDNAIEMLQFLYAHVDSKIFSIEEFSIIAPVILFNLANWFGDFGDDEKALEFSARGLEICIEHDGVSENNDTEQNFLDEKEDSGRYAFRNGGGGVGHSPHKTSGFSHH